MDVRLIIVYSIFFIFILLFATLIAIVQFFFAWKILKKMIYKGVFVVLQAAEDFKNQKNV